MAGRSLVLRDPEDEEDIKLPAKPMTVHEAQATFNEDERAIFNRVEKYVSKGLEQSIWWHWELGELLLEEEEKARKQDKTIQPQFLRRMSWGLGWHVHHGGGTLHHDRRMIQRYKTKSAMQEYLKLRGNDNERLSYTKLSTLAAVLDTEQRKQLASTALIEGWDVLQIADVIRNERKDGNPHGGSTGRPPKIPANERQCLQSMISTCHKLRNLYESSWMCTKFNIGTVMQQIPVDASNELVPKLLDKAINEVCLLRNQLDLANRHLTAAQERWELTTADIKARANSNGECEERDISDILSAAGTGETTVIEAKVVDEVDEPKEPVEATAEGDDPDNVSMAEYRRRQRIAAQPKKRRKKVAAQ